MEIENIRKFMTKTASEAGNEIVLPALGESTVWTNNDNFKQDEGIEADILANDFITNTLRKQYGSSSIISEETGKDMKSDYGFIVDPLDGTGNASGKRPHLANIFGVSIAYFEGDQIKAGVVYFPRLDILVKDNDFLSARFESNGLLYRAVAGNNYANLLSESERERVKSRIIAFDDVVKMYNIENNPKFCATYEHLRLLNPKDSAIMHWSPSILYAWDIAATQLMNTNNGNVVLNLETEKPLDIMNDFGIYEQNDKFKIPIGAVTGPEHIVDGMLHNIHEAEKGTKHYTYCDHPAHQYL